MPALFRALLRALLRGRPAHAAELALDRTVGVAVRTAVAGAGAAALIDEGLGVEGGRGHFEGW